MKTRYLLASKLLPYLALTANFEAAESSYQEITNDLEDEFEVTDSDEAFDQDSFIVDVNPSSTPSNAAPSPTYSTDQSYPGMNRANAVYSANPYPTNSYNLSFAGEFLYLASTVNKTYYAGLQQNSTIIETNYLAFSKEYSPAFRINANYSFSAQGWNLGADWMQLHNTTSKTKHYPYNESGTPILVYSDINNSFVPLANTTGGRLHGHQNLSFDQANLYFSKEFFISKYFTFSPIVAGTFLCFNHNFSTELSNQISGEYNKVHFKNKYYGFGFKFGGSSRFLLSQGLYILGDAEAGITYGTNKVHKRASTSNPSPNAVTEGVPAFGTSLTNNSKIFIPFIEAKMDMGWRRSFLKEKFALDIFIGYEYHLFFDSIITLQRASLGDQTEMLMQDEHNLGIQGMNLGMRFSF